MKKVKHAVEAAIIAALAQAPSILGSSAVRHFIEKHPADAVYVPVAIGILSAAYRWAKEKWGSKPAPAAPAAPAK